MGQGDFRVEVDSMGEVNVPRNAYWGAQTQRALENFPVSGLVFPRDLIYALGIIKKSAAEVNLELGLLPEDVAKGIAAAARELAEGRLDSHMKVDIFQTGSGTSTNMNANEVIANRGNELLGFAVGNKHPVHPNDHVNKGQSSNDVIPSAIHVAVLLSLQRDLVPALDHLSSILGQKAKEFYHIVKTGRTHLQDATPIRLGQEIGGYAHMVRRSVKRIRDTFDNLKELALGGTAVGTGVNAHPQFAANTIARVNQLTGLDLLEAENHFEAQGAQDALVEVSGALKTVAVSLMKIADDIRWLGSGPRNGLRELELPAVQPGSSIMPGKVNPVIPEALIQVCAQVIGNDLTVTLGGQWGKFELNTMMPVMAYNLLQSIHILANGVRLFATKCCAGLEANEEVCRQSLERNLAMATALAPHIGYDRAADIAKQAYETGETVRTVAEKSLDMDSRQLETILAPEKMV
jgi:fumarate hydratase class II